MSSNNEYVDYDDILLKQAIEIEEREAFTSEALKTLEENSRKRKSLDAMYPSIDDMTRNKIKENKEIINKELEKQGITSDDSFVDIVKEKNKVNYRARPGRVLI
ncbi:hypothetical protein GCM10007938_16050 [Vibrio zhanjiangensis]|uniref:Uncharacterized protein n=1 Tax=Vibrio zhanjiangensis TaxID=1046128 RepID=A0ABQ6EXB2_9VIBR|nr:hypothetical protein [Vibrio zhanjiangensis]GLT17827.1 hypothetical protein GCM10007938_16050 [Vibrio zhanjiangensis]